jgi:hypothetical protein
MLSAPAAHKLALFDLGKAIAINATSPDNYFLRGDCHSKLGNYEQVCVVWSMLRWQLRCAVVVKCYVLRYTRDRYSGPSLSLVSLSLLLVINVTLASAARVILLTIN